MKIYPELTSFTKELIDWLQTDSVKWVNRPPDFDNQETCALLAPCDYVDRTGKYGFDDIKLSHMVDDLESNVLEVIKKRYGDECGSIVAWNDQEQRTLPEVVEVFAEAGGVSQK